MQTDRNLDDLLNCYGITPADLPYVHKNYPIVYLGQRIYPEIYKYFPPQNIVKILSEIQYCAHGPTCTRCCFPYTGETYETFFYNKRRLAINLRYMYLCISANGHSCPTFSFRNRAFFPPFQGKLISTCTNDLCMNKAHVKKHRFLDPDLELLWRWVDLCEHGRTCQECHWLWLGPGVKTKWGVTYSGERYPIFSINATMNDEKRSTIYVSRVLYESLWGITIDRKYFLRKCPLKFAEGLCCSPHHCRVTSPMESRRTANLHLRFDYKKF